MRALVLLLAIALPAPLAAQSTPEQPPPTPAHTGWRTLLKDAGRDVVAFPKRRSTWVLLGAGAAGAAMAHGGDPFVRTHIVGNDRADSVFRLGKWVGNTYTQIGVAGGLWVVGRYVVAPATDEPQTNRISHLGFDLLRAQLVTQAFVHAIKPIGQRDRPSGECCSFPSGHAASAFAAAAVLERHLGYRASWPALLAASYVGASRLVDGRHFLSDVVFGAALGEAVGWTVVGRHGRQQYALEPVPVPGGFMIALVRDDRDDRGDGATARRP